MFVFIGNEVKVAISSSRIIKVMQFANKISVYYDTGEVDYIGDNGESVVSKIDIITMNYSTEENAIDVMRSFYVACAEKKGAFYF